MAGYKELRNEYNIVETTTTTTGKKAFIEDTTGTASLPALDDAFSVAYPNCTAQSISAVLYHIRTDQIGCAKDGLKYVVSYSTKQLVSATPSRPDPTDPEQIQCTAGLEMQSIDVPNPDTWFFQNVIGVQLNPSAPLAQPLTLTNPLGTISKTIEKATGATFTAYFAAQILPKLGKINAAAFTPVPDLTFEIGTCLFNSWSGSLILDKDGEKVWQVTLNFTYKILSRKVGNDQVDNVPYSHLYVYRKDPILGDPPLQDIWQAPCKVNANGNILTDYLYKPVDFTGLI